MPYNGAYTEDDLGNKVYDNGGLTDQNGRGAGTWQDSGRARTYNYGNGTYDTMPAPTGYSGGQRGGGTPSYTSSSGGSDVSGYQRNMAYTNSGGAMGGVQLPTVPGGLFHTNLNPAFPSGSGSVNPSNAIDSSNFQNARMSEPIMNAQIQAYLMKLKAQQDAIDAQKNAEIQMQVTGFGQNNQHHNDLDSARYAQYLRYGI